MASDKRKQTRDELLRELETLHSQLADPEADIDAIPVLKDRVEHPEEPTHSTNVADNDDSPLKATNPEPRPADDTGETAPTSQPRSPTAPLPGQRSLFEPAEAPAEPTPPPQTPRPVAKGENPFLPKHIRERLEERRAALASDVANASRYFQGQTPTEPQAKASNEAAQAAVDALVAEYLPRLEAELRQRLMRIVEDGTDDGNNA